MCCGFALCGAHTFLALRCRRGDLGCDCGATVAPIASTDEGRLIAMPMHPPIHRAERTAADRLGCDISGFMTVIRHSLSALSAGSLTLFVRLLKYREESDTACI